MRKHNFKNLLIWQKGMDLVDLVYDYLENLPKSERFNLIDQMQRCVVSIPSNIAEGSGKRTNKEYAHYLGISLASSYELETQALICERRKYGNLDLLKIILERLTEEQRMIYAYQQKIEKEINR